MKRRALCKTTRNENLQALYRRASDAALKSAFETLGSLGVATARNALPNGWLLGKAVGFDVGKNRAGTLELNLRVRSGFAKRKNGDPAEYGVHYERGWRKRRKGGFYRRPFMRPALVKIAANVERVVAEKIREELRKGTK